MTRAGVFRAFVIAALFSANVVFPAVASAHPVNYGAIDTTLVAKGKTILLSTVANQKFDGAASDHAGQISVIGQYFAQHLSIREGGAECAFTLADFNNRSNATSTSFVGSFACPEPVTAIAQLFISSTLFSDTYASYDHFVDLWIGDKHWSLVFTIDKAAYPGAVSPTALGSGTPPKIALPASGAGTSTPNMTAPLPETTAANGAQTWAILPSIFQQFLWLGMMHIWTGYDHILFLLSIILLLRSLRKIIILVTGFTLAHSITLILAGLGVITLSPRIVEPLIALSIAYMAARNYSLLRANEGSAHIPERWATTFGFGLIHGLGFAGALKATALPTAFFVPALVVFNVGIEVGQLGILALAVPLLMHTDRLRHRRRVLIAVSFAIFFLAMFWFFQRVLS